MSGDVRSYNRIKRCLDQLDDCPGVIMANISTCMFDVPIYNSVRYYLRLIGGMDFLDMADVIAEENMQTNE